MADMTMLDALQAFHQELLAVREGRADAVETLANDFLIPPFENELERLWSKPPRSDNSQKAVKSGATSSSASKKRGS